MIFLFHYFISTKFLRCYIRNIESITELVGWNKCFLKHKVTNLLLYNILSCVTENNVHFRQNTLHIAFSVSYKILQP